MPPSDLPIELRLEIFTLALTPSDPCKDFDIAGRWKYDPAHMPMQQALPYLTTLFPNVQTPELDYVVQHYVIRILSADVEKMQGILGRLRCRHNTRLQCRCSCIQSSRRCMIEERKELVRSAIRRLESKLDWQHTRGSVKSALHI